MNQELSEQDLDTLFCGEDLGVEFWNSSKLMPDELYFDYAKHFRAHLEYLYNHQWTCKWIPNSLERAEFCVKIMSVWVTCVKHTGIVDINYLYAKDGILLLKQLILNLSPWMPFSEIRALEEMCHEFDSCWEDIARDFRRLKSQVIEKIKRAKADQQRRREEAHESP